MSQDTMPWFHHMLVHFPAALSVVTVGVVLVALIRPRQETWRLARLVAYLAAAGALLSSIAGLGSAAHFVSEGGNAAALQAHRNAALFGTVLLAAAAVVARLTRQTTARRFHILFAVAVTLGAGGAGVAAHLGGAMLHEGMGPPWFGGTPHHHHHEDDGEPAPSSSCGEVLSAPRLPCAVSSDSSATTAPSAHAGSDGDAPSAHHHRHHPASDGDQD
jgi:hypothetical protein